MTREELLRSLTQEQRSASISFLDWSTIPDIPESFDLNDAYRRWNKETYTQLEKAIKPFESPEIKSTIADMIGCWKLGARVSFRNHHDSLSATLQSGSSSTQ